MEPCRIIRVAGDEPTQISRRLRRCIAPQFRDAPGDLDVMYTTHFHPDWGYCEVYIT